MEVKIILKQVHQISGVDFWLVILTLADTLPNCSKWNLETQLWDTHGTHMIRDAGCARIMIHSILTTTKTMEEWVISCHKDLFKKRAEVVLKKQERLLRKNFQKDQGILMHQEIHMLQL